MSTFRTAVLVLLLPLAAAAGAVSIRMEGGSFIVEGWRPGPDAPASGWQSIFSVYAGDNDVPPMLGTYTVENSRLVFRPRFEPSPSIRLRAVFRPPSGSPVEAVFEPKHAKAAPSTRVEHVYPSTDLLPANQLKFYIHFSAPMSRGEAWQRIKLLDGQGVPVELPFLEIEQELWDRDYRRLTVLFDPGRIKRGLYSLEEAGPALEENRRYTLVIDSGWRDARGVPLTGEYRKAFSVGPALRSAVEPARWKIHVPPPESTDALRVQFDRPMDAALSMRLLSVLRDGVPVAGTPALAEMETEWRFVPSQPWKEGEYSIVVDTFLEDLAGNRVGRPFDVDVFEQVTKRVENSSVSLPFRIGR